MSAPWFKFFPRDYLTDSKVRLLSREHRSILLDLWCYCSIDGSVPADAESIARLLGETVPVIRKAMEKLNSFFVESDGQLYSNRLRMESEAYESKCQKLRESASKGGRKKVANALANALANAKANAKANDLANPSETETEEESTTTPLSPLAGATAKAKKPRKSRFQAEDITPENAEFLRKVYDRAPSEHPITGEPVHKGPFAEAARAFQGIIDSGEATPRELMAVGTVYYRAEILGEAWVEAITRVWDSRPRAMMQVSTLYGPTKRAYRQILPLARKLIEFRDAEASRTKAEPSGNPGDSGENIFPLEAAS